MSFSTNTYCMRVPDRRPAKSRESPIDKQNDTLHLNSFAAFGL